MLDPFAIPKYLAFVTRAVVRRVGWKWVLIGWALSSVFAVILNYKT